MATTDNVEIIMNVSNRIPFNIIREELSTNRTDYQAELREIATYYKTYSKGATFNTEGSGGDYIASQVAFKKAAQLINKEARFMFAASPDININYDGNMDSASNEVKDALDVYRKLIKNVLKKNMFFKTLVQSAKDCFIGKRIAIQLNFNEETGITISFFDAFSFVYETNPDNKEQLTKLVTYTVTQDSSKQSEKRIFKKKYELQNGVVYFEDKLYDGIGNEIEVINPLQETLLDEIPAVVIVNDGLLSNINGESDIENIYEYEGLYSKLSNADVDAERKGMNQIRYTVDMDESSTKNLSAGPGAYWDLQSNQNLENAAPAIGTLATNLDYSSSLQTTLDRVRNAMFDQMEIPDITPENLAGVITSGKGLKAIYWPLSVRCDEKFMGWKSKIEYLVESIIAGSLVYPKCAANYIGDAILQPVAYEIEAVRNSPLLDDESEEKQTDMAQINYQVMSRKTYMKKWFNMTDNEIDEELKQIALERELLEDSYSNPFGNINNG